MESIKINNKLVKKLSNRSVGVECQGVAKIGKGCEQISGDTFLMTALPGGKEGVVLSDGMGSGEEAFRESAMVVEMMEELLTAGFPMEMAIQMLNTALVMGREEE